MGNWLRLLFEFVIRPIYIVIGGILVFFGNVETIQNWVLPRLPSNMQNIVLKALMNETVVVVFQWLSRSWGYLFLIMVSVAIFEGFYRKTAKYIIEPREAKLEVTPGPNVPTEKYVFLDIFNREKRHLNNCLLKIEQVTYTRGGKSEKLSMPNKYTGPITIVSGDHQEVRIAEIYGNHITFIYYGRPIQIPPPETGLEPGTYIVEIKIFGDIDGNPIKPIDETLLIEFHRSQKSKYLLLSKQDAAAEHRLHLTAASQRRVRGALQEKGRKERRVLQSRSGR